MQQTLLALLGLLIITTLSFSQQQAGVRSQQQAIRAEYRQMALGVAKQTIEVVRNRTFDQAGEHKVGNFTEESSPDWGGKDCIESHQFDKFDSCGAIEHFHDDETQAMDHADGTIEAKGPEREVYFQVEVEVHYMEEEGSKLVRADKSDAPTSLKEVTVRVQDCPEGSASGGNSCEGAPFLDPPIVFSEVLRYTN
jgi:hypothetical protein